MRARPLLFPNFVNSADRHQYQLILQEAQVFLKKRAVLEDEYGKGLQKLARQTSEVYAMSDGKAG